MKKLSQVICPRVSVIQMRVSVFTAGQKIRTPEMGQRGIPEAPKNKGFWKKKTGEK